MINVLMKYKKKEHGCRKFRVIILKCMIKLYCAYVRIKDRYT